MFIRNNADTIKYISYLYSHAVTSKSLGQVS